MSFRNIIVPESVSNVLSFATPGMKIFKFILGIFYSGEVFSHDAAWFAPLGKYEKKTVLDNVTCNGTA